MWRDFLGGFGLELRDPTDEATLASAEQALGTPLPRELRSLLLEANGVFDEYGFAVVRPVAEIVNASTNMWGFDDDDIYMAFAPHIFVAGEANGDEYFHRVIDGVCDDEIFAWLHEDDSRSHYAYSLRSYIEDRVEETRKRFDPEFDNALLDSFFDCLAFIALSDDSVINPDAAVRQLESTAAALKAAPDSQRRDFAARAQGLAARTTDPERAEFLSRVSSDFSLFPDV